MDLYVELVNTSVSLQRIFEVLNEPVSNQNASQGIKIVDAIRHVTYENLSKSYGEKAVLIDMNLTFEIGKHYAIVGPNGSGKSTMVDILAKLESPEQGQVLVNGLNLADVNFASWMDKISVNLQNSWFFNGTIRENLTYGVGQFNDREVDSLMKVMNLDRLTINSNILDLKISDSNLGLSGGEFQKLCLVRSLMKKAEILVMDESTSAIDKYTEQRIIEYAFNELDFKTIILVTHQLKLLEFVDEIIYIENGCLLERGSLQDLIEKKGPFHRLFFEQYESDCIIPSHKVIK